MKKFLFIAPIVLAAAWGFLPRTSRAQLYSTPAYGGSGAFVPSYTNYQTSTNFNSLLSPSYGGVTDTNIGFAPPILPSGTVTKISPSGAVSGGVANRNPAPSYVVAITNGYMINSDGSVTPLPASVSNPATTNAPPTTNYYLLQTNTINHP